MNYKEQIKKENIKNYYKNKSKNKSIINQYYKKINDNIINQIFNSITKRTYKTLLRQNVNKKYTYLELLGCNLLEFELYLLDKLTDGMTFDNYGEWEIDHIKPISLFNLDNDKELFECCNFKNLQPLWKKDNILKSNQYFIVSETN
jgi:hypothetical protein